MSKFFRHDACPDCGSSNNLAVYDDHEYCFSEGCGRYVNYERNNTISNESESPKPKKSLYSLPATTQPSIRHRNLDASTVQKYKVTVFDDPDSEVEVIFPRFDNEGQHSANQIRMRGKEFRFQGDSTSSSLFGQNFFPAGGRSFTITEGYYDTMAAFQMTGSRYPNVGVMSASTAKKEVVNCIS